MIREITTPEQAKAYRYNRWAGNPSGHAYDTKRCCEEISTGGRGPMFVQCSKKPGFGPHGLYCHQHDPEAVAKRDAERSAKWEARHEKEMAPYRAMQKLPKIEQQLADAKRLLTTVLDCISETRGKDATDAVEAARTFLNQGTPQK